MATPIADVINYLRTSGGSSLFIKVNYADQDDIVLSFGNNVTTRQANFIKAAFLNWGKLIDIPFAFGNSDVNITVTYGTNVPTNALGVSRTSLLFPTDHHTNIVLSQADFPDGGVIEIGGMEYNTMLHELGHALGLTHPGPYNGEGVLEYGETNVYPEDTTQYTVMSYFGDALGPDTFDLGGFSSTPMLHDIAAIQSIYGANMSTRTGDTVYGFNSNTARSLSNGFTFDPYNFAKVDNPSFTIWDAGGIDTIDASGYGYYYDTSTGGEFLSQIIDLRAGNYSSIGDYDVFNQDREVVGARPLVNNIAIAFGVTIENAIGGEGDDHITGNDAANVLNGGPRGDDIIFGGGGNDTIDGGDDNDILFGEDGNDHLIGGPRDDNMYGGDGNDLLDPGHGTDIVSGGDGFDTATYAHQTRAIWLSADRASDRGDIVGDVFASIEAWILTPFDDVFNAFATDDRIDGGNGDDQIFGWGGDDTMIGNFGNDIMSGGDGEDRIDGGAGADQMSGGRGDDTFFVDNVGDTVSESILIAQSGVDLVISSVDFALGVGVENLTLSVATNAPLNGTGNSLANTITGNAGSNTLDGGGGVDMLIGRGGHDTYIVDNAGDVVDEGTGGSADIDTVRSSVTFNLSPLGSAQTRGEVENLTLTGAIAINGIGNSLDNILIGNSAANVLTALEGADRLDGGGGADTMFGGTGNDTYVVDNAADRVDETGGAAADIDTVLSSVSFSLINTVQTRGNVENVTLTGNAAINATGNGLGNTLTSNAGSNLLTGGAGNDTYAFAGSFGNDTISDSSGSDKIVVTGKIVLQDASRAGNDLVLEFSTGTITIDNHFTTGQIESLQVGSRTYVLANGLIGGDLPGIISGSQASEVMDGKGGDDLLYGGGGNDTLLGGLGNDLLDGGQGRDILDGGAGDDVLTGGRGADTFVFKPGFGHDTITDFSIFEDRLDISGFHNWPGFSRSGSTLELDFGHGDTLSISFDAGVDFWRLGEKFAGGLFDF